MEIQILHIDECPNWSEAGERVRAVLDESGRADVEIAFTLLTTSEDAAAVPFAGSPTIVVDGEDLFPSDGRTADLACRVYLTPTGFAGLPTVQQLRDALNR
ncbi:MAG: hypothetical protein ABL886_11165 [Rhodoglobus sp.]